MGMDDSIGNGEPHMKNTENQRKPLNGLYASKPVDAVAGFTEWWQSSLTRVTANPMDCSRSRWAASPEIARPALPVDSSLAGILIDRLDNPAFLIDAQCRLIRANVRALAWMHAAPVFETSSNRLVPRDAGDRERWLDSIAGLDPSQPRLVHLRGVGEPGLIGLRRLGPPEGDGNADWIQVSVTSDLVLKPSMLGAYVKHIRLTPSEARVFAEILRSVEPKRIARQQGLEEETVRSHLKSIRRKANVRTITQLMATVARLPRL